MKHAITMLAAALAVALANCETPGVEARRTIIDVPDPVTVDTVYEVPVDAPNNSTVHILCMAPTGYHEEDLPVIDRNVQLYFDSLQYPTGESQCYATVGVYKGNGFFQDRGSDTFTLLG